MGAPASGGGVLNDTEATGYAANSAPDFIVKAFEPGRGHYKDPCFVTAGNPRYLRWSCWLCRRLQ